MGWDMFNWWDSSVRCSSGVVRSWRVLSYYGGV